MSGAPIAVLPLAPGVGPVNQAAKGPALHRAAQRFEAMFLGEMIRLSRPKPDGSNPFAAGQGEQLWGSFMDDAMGQVMAAHGGTGLAEQIEAALAKAAGPAGSRR